MNDLTSRKWHQVTLRFFGDDLPEPQKMNTLLQLSATSFGRKGGHLKDNPKYMAYKTSFWNYSYTTNSSVPFEEQLDGFLTLLEARRATIAGLLTPEGQEAELFLGYGSSNGQGGAFFSATLLSRIVALGLSLDLDLYPPERKRIYPKVKARSVVTRLP